MIILFRKRCLLNSNLKSRLCAIALYYERIVITGLDLQKLCVNKHYLAKPHSARGLPCLLVSGLNLLWDFAQLRYSTEIHQGNLLLNIH